MDRRGHREPSIDPSPETRGGRDGAPDGRRQAGSSPNLSDLPVAGLTRRRIAIAIGALVAAWVLVQFAHQVGEASDAVSRVESVRASNDALTGQVAALQRELDLVAKEPFIEQQARRYRLGTPDEIPFRLADDAPPLPSDAPGAASVKLGATTEHRTPLESWLDVLLGSQGPPAG
jgi:cell division protein FtsB